MTATSAAVSAYAYERLTEDILAVADAVEAPRFLLWGFSYGANVGRYLASRSDRVQAMVYIGIGFGPAVDGSLRSYVENMPNRPAFASAMLEYPPVEPADMCCPTLWLVGSKNELAMASVTKYQPALVGTSVTLAVVDGLNHPQELDEIDRVFDLEIEFSRAHAGEGRHRKNERA